MDTDECKQFGQRLEVILQTQHISRRTIAEGANCTSATIGRWLRGEVPYCVMILAELHRTHGIDLNTLICGKDNVTHTK